MVGWEFDAVIDLFCIVNTTAESTALMCVRGINSLSLTILPWQGIARAKNKVPVPENSGLSKVLPFNLGVRMSEYRFGSFAC